MNNEQLKSIVLANCIVFAAILGAFVDLIIQGTPGNNLGLMLLTIGSCGSLVINAVVYFKMKVK